MAHIEKKDMEFVHQFLSSDETCECAPGEYHNVEADDWRRIQKILKVLADVED